MRFLAVKQVLLYNSIYWWGKQLPNFRKRWMKCVETVSDITTKFYVKLVVLSLTVAEIECISVWTLHSYFGTRELELSSNYIHFLNIFLVHPYTLKGKIPHGSRGSVLQYIRIFYALPIHRTIGPKILQWSQWTLDGFQNTAFIVIKNISNETTMRTMRTRRTYYASLHYLP